MDAEGPDLEKLLHRLAETPGEFLQIDPAKPGQSNLLAIACDMLRALSPAHPPELHPSRVHAIALGTPARQKLVSLVCWLLKDDWFVAQGEVAPAAWRLLESPRLARLAGLVKVDTFVTDPDRREELVRVCLEELKLRPRGETAAQAADRLTRLDSVERERVLRMTAAAEKRAREIREAMARAAAQDAASRYGE